MSASPTSEDLINFINQNLPFVRKAYSTPGPWATATRVGAMAWEGIEESWRANSAVLDESLISNLDALLDRRLRAIDTETFDLQRFESRFQASKVEVAEDLPKNIRSEAEAKEALNCFRHIVQAFLRYAGIQGSFGVEMERENTKSDYTFCLSDGGKCPKVLGEVKKPQLMNQIMQDIPNPVFFSTRKDDNLRHVIKQCATGMGAFQTRWLFLTSYNIWTIMRLVTTPGANPTTYLVYSPFTSVGETEHDTAIFRAFLSLLLCEEAELAGISAPDAPGPSTRNHPEAPRSVCQPSDVSRENNDGRTKPNSTAPLRGQSIQLFLSPFRPLGAQEPYVLRAVSSEFCGFNSVDLQLKRIIGCGGYTSVVEACVVGSDASVALKLIERLNKKDDYRFDAFDREEKTYQRLEQARDKGIRTIAPRFYERYADKFMRVLVLELQGKALGDWSDLSGPDKMYVFDLFLTLHRLGINHGDVRPPNVVHGIDTSFRIIDFSLSEDHDCPDKEGMQPVNRSAARRLRCDEFMDLYDRLWPSTR